MTPRFEAAVKRALLGAQLVKNVLDKWHEENDWNMTTGLCAYIAVLSSEVMKQAGFACAAVAGSATWRVVSEANDDGVSPTHFSYFYTPAPEKKSLLENDQMCEVHCWAVALDAKLDRTAPQEVLNKQAAAVPMEAGYIIDPSVLYMKPLAERILGRPVSAPVPAPIRNVNEAWDAGDYQCDWDATRRYRLDIPSVIAKFMRSLADYMELPGIVPKGVIIDATDLGGRGMAIGIRFSDTLPPYTEGA